jgi:hypothetical protein
MEQRFGVFTWTLLVDNIQILTIKVRLEIATQVNDRVNPSIIDGLKEWLGGILRPKRIWTVVQKPIGSCSRKEIKDHIPLFGKPFNTAP